MCKDIKKLQDIDIADMYKKVKELAREKTCSLAECLKSKRGNNHNGKRKDTIKME